MPDPACRCEQAINYRPAFTVVVKESDVCGIGASLAIDLQLNDRAIPLLASIDCIQDFAIRVRRPKMVGIGPSKAKWNCSRSATSTNPSRTPVTRGVNRVASANSHG